jgi:hypothetical protein
VSEVEAEEMKFDPDYSIKFNVGDIKRLLALPPQIQLALPFLYSNVEVKAHELLTRFTMEQGEKYFLEKDKATQDEEVKQDGKGLTAEQQREAERQLNVLLKERRCAEARSLPKEEQSEEQVRVASEIRAKTWQLTLFRFPGAARLDQDRQDPFAPPVRGEGGRDQDGRGARLPEGQREGGVQGW